MAALEAATQQASVNEPMKLLPAVVVGVLWKAISTATGIVIPVPTKSPGGR